MDRTILCAESAAEQQSACPGNGRQDYARTQRFVLHVIVRCRRRALSR